MNILLDLDGTLTDPKEGITKCFSYALQKLDKEIPEDLEWCIGPPLQDSFAELLGDDSQVEEAVSLFRERFSEKGILENQIYKGIDSTLSALNEAGFKLYLATSKPHTFATRVLKNFDISKYFVSEYGSELDGTRKDKTSLIQYIITQENLDPTKTVMVGDRKFDLIGAHNNKIKSIAVTYGYGSLEEIQGEKPFGIVNSPKELLSFIENSLS
jgi:phosphoglycolate phosphatase